MTPGETRLQIETEMDVTRAILQTGRFCTEAGLDPAKGKMVATSVSELARNIIKYAVRGEVILRAAARGFLRGVEIVAVDHGPGIEDLQRALQDHYSSSGTLGLGLPGVKRIMDEFELESEPGRGTQVTARKWR